MVMRFERLLPAAALTLMALWAIGFIAAVLRDDQFPAAIALGAVVAVLLPVFLAACVLALVVWPLVRAMEDDGDQDGPLPSER
jgi:hypothetical protein